MMTLALAVLVANLISTAVNYHYRNYGIAMVNAFVVGLLVPI